MSSSGKFAFGATIGLILGGALVYFSDKEKRKNFVDNVSKTADKAKSSVVEGYYEAKERYEKYRDLLKRKAEEVGESVSDFIEKGSCKSSDTLLDE